jgi:hypothetical protein
MMNEERPEMQSQSNEFRPQVAERLFLAVVNQAISDVLDNGKRQKKQSDGCSARISIPWTDYSRVLLSHLSPLKEGKSEAPES